MLFLDVKFAARDAVVTFLTSSAYLAASDWMAPKKTTLAPI